MLLQQVTLFKSFVSLKKARNNWYVCIEANVGSDSGGTSFIHSDGYESSDLCVCENYDLLLSLPCIQYIS